MFKSIPKSSISNRSFKTFKSFRTDDTNHPVIHINNSQDYNFVSESAQSTIIDDNTLYHRPLYNSLLSKYYNHDGNVFNLFGKVDNISNLSWERRIPDTFQIISLPQSSYGEGIKENSITLTKTENGETFVDRDGNLESQNYLYVLESIDMNDETLTLSDGYGDYIFDINSIIPDEFGIDFTSGSADLIYDGESTIHTILGVDFTRNQYKVEEEIDIVDIQTVKNGNVFYSDGLIVFTDDNLFSSYDLEYKSTHTIHETEVLADVDVGEFNVSQNPSAVTTTISGSYFFETTPITNVRPQSNVKITTILDKEIRRSYSGSYGNITGSWEDYVDNRWTDPTGSYLTPFITTVGLYDEDDNLLVIAKLPQPIKSYPDLPINFLIRFDT